MTKSVEWIVGGATAILAVVLGWLSWAAIIRSRAQNLRRSVPTPPPYMAAQVAKVEDREIALVVAKSETARAEIAEVATLEDDARTDAVSDLLRRRR